MSKEIWKYKISASANQTIEMPKGAEILSLQVQGKRPCIWVLVNPDAEKEVRSFELHGTGFTIVDDSSIERKFIGTFQTQNGIFVFHLFEVTN